MSINPAAADNSGMNHEQLFDQAVQLAYESFEEPTDEHITGVYARLAFNWACGMDASSAVTLH